MFYTLMFKQESEYQWFACIEREYCNEKNQYLNVVLFFTKNSRKPPNKQGKNILTINTDIHIHS